MSEWQQFKVGNVSGGNGNDSCRPFNRVSHTSHIDAALGIIECGGIRAGLVFDKSKLNSRRILVSWVSPNNWGLGFRYGNVRFEFDFASLIQKKRFYWVESVAYMIKACRILITDEDRDAELEPYDPTTAEGPWWHDKKTDTHYFNNHHCLEFMVEGSISIDSICNFDFVSHHNDYCNLHRMFPRNCNQLGMQAMDAATRFFTQAATTQISLDKVSSFFFYDKGKPKTELQFVLERFGSRSTRKVAFQGLIEASSEQALPVMRAAMSAYAFGRIDDAKQLATLFKGENDFAEVAAKILAEQVGYSDWKKLIP